MDVVTERLLHEERKLLSQENNGDEQAMMYKGRNGSQKKVHCFWC